MFKSSPIQASEPVFVSVSEWQGKQRFDIRHYYSVEVTEDGSWLKVKAMGKVGR